MSDEFASRRPRMGVLVCGRCGHPTSIASGSTETEEPPPAWPEGATGRFRCAACGRVNVVYECSSCRQGVPIVRRWIASAYVCPWCDVRSHERIPGSFLPQLGRRWPGPVRAGIESFRAFVHGIGGRTRPGPAMPRSASIGKVVGQALSIAVVGLIVGALIAGQMWVELALLAGAPLLIGLFVVLLLLKK